MKFQTSKRVLISSLLLTILNIVFITYQVLNEGDYFLYGTLCFVFQFLVFSVYFIPNAYFYEFKRFLVASRAKQDKLERNYSDLEQKITRYFEAIKFSNEKQKNELAISFNKVNENIDSATTVLVDQNGNLLSHINHLESGINNGFSSLSRELDEKFHLMLEQGSKTRNTTLESIKRLDKSVDKSTEALIEKIVDVSKEQKFTRDSIDQLDKSVDKSTEALIEKIVDVSQGQISTLDSIVQLGKMIEKESGVVSETLSKQQVYLEAQIRNQLETTYSRLDALMSIHQALDLNSPLPIMHQWAVSSDYALDLVRAVIEKGEGSVIDIGSGISTILMGYAIQINGNGKVISLEHSEEFVKKTRKLIAEHKLEGFCEVYLCPLITYKLNGKKWLWYDTENVSFDKNTAVISVDGPRGDTQELARYPAVPLLNKYINSQTVVYLDDGGRQDEKDIASMWEKEYKLSSSEYRSHKGYFKFTRTV